MAEVVLFHHVRGLTPGVIAIADELRAAGHTVHTPDLFEGQTFDSIDDGLAYVQGVGFEEAAGRGVSAAQAYPAEVVYAGISFGVMAAQQLTQNRPGAKGALFLESCAPVSFFGTWPADVPVQIHGMDADPSFVGEGDIDAARELLTGAKHGELILYPGDGHLFTDSSLPSYDKDAATLLMRRVLDFLRDL
jgi:dienelactone hydrolase